MEKQGWKSRVFVCPKLLKWKDAFESPNCPYPFSFDVDSVGFLEVYSTKKAFQKAHPNIEPLSFIVEEKETKGG